MCNIKYTLVFLAVFACTYGAELPSDIKLCKRSADNQVLSKCILDAISTILPKLAKGIPALGIAPSEPLKLNSFTVGEGTGVVHVVQNYKNAEFQNFMSLKPKKVNATISDKEVNIKMEAFLDHMTMKADYNMSGRILVLPVYGNGKTTVEIYKIKILFTIKAVTLKKQGETYLNVKDLKIVLDPKKLTYNFENLFDGNKALGDNMNNILNENDLDVYRDVRKGYDEVASNICKDIANSVVSKIPLSKLILA